MKNVFLASLLAAFASSASAGLLDGKTLNYEYDFPALGTPYAPAPPENPPSDGNYVVSAAVEIANIASDIGTLDLQSDGMTAHFVRDGTFGTLGSGTYNGFVITDVFGQLPAFSSFSIVSNTAVSGTPSVSFDADHLYVNWAGLPFNAGDVVFAVTAIPEPETTALLLAGLSLLGFRIARRKR